MSDLICFCFGYSVEYIEQDIRANGRSLIMEKIMEEKRIGGCDCASKNPKRK